MMTPPNPHWSIYSRGTAQNRVHILFHPPLCVSRFYLPPDPTLIHIFRLTGNNGIQSPRLSMIKSPQCCYYPKQQEESKGCFNPHSPRVYTVQDPYTAPWHEEAEAHPEDNDLDIIVMRLYLI